MPNIAGVELDTCVNTLKSLSQSTEGKFLEIGGQLARATGLVEKITADFDQLSAKLQSETLSTATRDLTGTASRVSELGTAMAAQRLVNERLQRPIPAIGADLSRIQQMVGVVAILATNSKIAAAGIESSETGFSRGDFLTFAREVDRLVGIAGASLTAFRQDLAQLDRELQQASHEQDQFARQQTEAINNIPKWLRDSVESAAEHGRQAAGASQTVGERSRQVRRRVSDAVMSLQIGDITRQRLEHVEEALQILSKLIEGGHENSEQEIWWRSLGEAEQRTGIAEICRLQSVQLAHAAKEFEHEVQQIIVGLRAIAEDTREVLRLGSAAFGASDQSGGSFLGELQTNVDRALDLLRRFQIAQGETDRTAASVLDAVDRSARHMATVKSLETDLRLLGLNMTFRSDRLGNAGAALSVIAQELRGCADQTTEGATAVTQGLDSLTATAREFSSSKERTTLADLEAIEKTMSSSVAVYREAGQSIAGALATFLRDGEGVAALLDSTVAAITFQEGMVQTLRRLSGDLAGAANCVSKATAEVSFKARVLSLIDTGYTMESERKIHNILSTRASGVIATKAALASRLPAETTSIEDVLF